MKQKTRKALTKRFKITGRGKILHRSVHQNHFNAKETGNQTRSKRGSSQLKKADTKHLKKQL